MRRRAACFERSTKAVSSRLAALAQADQDARRDGLSPEDILQDRLRLNEVMALFADGCVQSADDLYNTALILQHGELSEHYLLAFHLALRSAVDGRRGAISLSRKALDRYLMFEGYAQVFGTQRSNGSFFKPYESSADSALCYWPMDEEFDGLRGARTRPSGLEDCAFPAKPAAPVAGPFIALMEERLGERLLPDVTPGS